MNPKVSVIIPVYNAEMYIHECIESILTQSFQSFELILINDGSSDNSKSILGKYKDDSRVIVLDQSNSGVCAARNRGLDQAIGEMITFVDADDWMPQNGLELLYEEYIRTGADMVVANMSFVEAERRREIHIFNGPFTTTDKNWINQYELSCIGYCYNPNPGTKMNTTGLGSMGNKLYKRAIIEKYKLRFDPYTLGIYEDNLFVLNYLEHVQKLSFIDKSVYNYRRVTQSNSRGYKPETLEINRRIFEKIQEYINNYKQNCINEFNKAFYVYVIRRLDASLAAYFFAKDNKKHFVDKCRELKSTINSEPYKTAIDLVEWKKLNPQNHRWVWATAKTKSSFCMWIGYMLHKTVRSLISRI